MSLKAGRVGVNPKDVDPIDGSINPSSVDSYTKAQADAKFETQSHAASTYETQTAASSEHALLQPKTLAVPIHMLSGSKLTVEDSLQGLNSEKMRFTESLYTGSANDMVNSGIYDSDMEAKDRRKIVISKLSWLLMIIIFILIII